MSKKIYAKIGAVLIAVTAGFATVSVATAGTASAYDCTDAIHLYWAYYDNGYYYDAQQMLSNIVGYGCLD